MKKLFTFLFAIVIYLSSYGQANTYFHDKIDTTIYATTTGTNTYTGTNLDPNFNVARYNRGLLISTFFLNGNTAASTYRLVTKTGTLSALPIKKQGGSALASGDIPDSSAVQLLFYGSFWRLIGIHKPTDAWLLTGNSGTTPGTNFIGTTDAQDLVFKRNSTEIMRINDNGLGIFTNNPQYPLHIKKGITNPHIFAAFEQTNGGVDSCAANIRFKGIGDVVDWGIEKDKDFLIYNMDSTRFNCYSTRNGNFEIGVDNGAVRDAYRLIVNSDKTSDFITISKGSAYQGAIGYDASGGYLNINNLAGNAQTVKFASSGDNWINTGQNLGIGTTSPNGSYKVTLKGSGTFNGLIIQDAQGDINNALWYYQGEGGSLTLLADDGSTVLATINNHFVADDIINDGKNFGIGVAGGSTLARLHAKGLGATTATANFLTTNSAGAIGLTVDDGLRVYGSAIHNNANAVTGTVNQYIASGTYTATLTNVTNISASTAYQAQWIRVGNVVTVSGQVDIDQTAGGAYELGISLPIASNLTLATNCSGAGMGDSGTDDGLWIKGDTTNDRASLNGASSNTANHAHYFTFTYLIQ